MDELTRINLETDESLRKIHDKIDKIEDWEKLPSQPLVSICMAAYNHEQFIVSALEGVLMQKVDFPYEIIIKEDKSTDNTKLILKDYQERYPDKIRLWLCKENLYSQGLKPKAFLFSRGKYISSCEGDDYWTDPLKLQKQIDVLEENDSIVASFTNATFLDMLNNTKEIYVKGLSDGEVSVKDIFEQGARIYPTASIVYRRDSFCKQNHILVPEMAGDELLIYKLALSGSVHFLDHETCVYRRWSGGVYSSIVNDVQKLVMHKKRDVVGYQKFDDLTSGVVNGYLRKRIRINSLFIVKNSLSKLDKLRYSRYLTIKDILRIILKK